MRPVYTLNLINSYLFLSQRQLHPVFASDTLHWTTTGKLLMPISVVPYVNVLPTLIYI